MSPAPLQPRGPVADFRRARNFGPRVCLASARDEHHVERSRAAWARSREGSCPTVHAMCQRVEGSDARARYVRRVLACNFIAYRRIVALRRRRVIPLLPRRGRGFVPSARGSNPTPPKRAGLAGQMCSNLNRTIVCYDSDCGMGIALAARWCIMGGAASRRGFLGSSCASL